MRAFVAVAFTFLVMVFLLPASASAQAEVAGIVRDSSGAVLPGVTVEAASPALIEKVRSVVTDGSGQYRIIDLRPGAYTITFTLTGFNTIRRDGVDLTGSAIFQVSVEMRVGALEETITVTGEAPIVDVQSVTQQRVLNQDLIAALPSGRKYYSLGALIPGVTSNSNDVGGARGDTMSSLTVHGSKAGDQRIMLNGVNTSGMSASGNISGVVPNVGAAQEVTIDTSSVSAELGQGGVRVNFVPRDGGNTFAGSVFATYSNSSLQGNNYTQRLKDRGLSTPDSVEKIWDFTPAFGGPLMRDRLWFWSAGMHSGANSGVAGMFENRNAFNPNLWTYEADPGKPAQNKGHWWNAQMRTTWQAAPSHKVAFTYDQQAHCRCPNSISATRAPEASVDRRFPQQRVMTAEWTSPLTNRILAEFVGLHRTTRWMDGHMFVTYPDQVATTMPLMIGVTEQSTGLQYRGWNTYNNNWNNNYFFRGSMSYITGSHAFKAGFNNTTGFLQNRVWDFNPVSYRFNNGLPNQVTIRATPTFSRGEVDHDLGLYAQDRWTLRRLTVSGGLRYDDFKSSYPELKLGPGRLVPTRNMTFPAQANLDWQDLTYRSGLSYDVFGNGKTALKMSLNKYVAGQTLGGLGSDTSAVNTLVTTTTRSWTDTNGNFAPDCNLTLPAANAECGAMANANFGTAVPGDTYDADLLTGRGHRPFSWEFSAGVQREIIPRVSVDVGYFRRWFGNFQVTDNLSVNASDFDTFSITAPADSRLPGGGGQTISGLYNLKTASFGRATQNFNTLSDKYGKQIEHWNGMDVSAQARLQNGVQLSGGISTGRRTEDSCEIQAKLPEAAPTNPYCHTREAYQTQIKFYGVYTVPRIDVLVSGTFQSVPGPNIQANFNATNAVVMPSLGRPLSGGTANVTVNLVEPGVVYGERLNQLDLRFGKILRVGGARTTLSLDLYNALNNDTIRTQNNTFGPAWQRPTAISLARFAKISAQFDF